MYEGERQSSEETIDFYEAAKCAGSFHTQFTGAVCGKHNTCELYSYLIDNIQFQPSILRGFFFFKSHSNSDANPAKHFSSPNLEKKKKLYTVAEKLVKEKKKKPFGISSFQK